MVNIDSTDAPLSPDGLTPGKFQQVRKRADVPPGLNVPIQGFGPSGEFTLFVPSPNCEVGIVFEAGRPVRREAAGCMADPQILALRDRVIRAMRPSGPTQISVDFCFLEYAAAVLKVNYNLSDADLGFLLSGTKWHKAMVEHAMGGEGIAQALRQMLPRIAPTLSQLPVEALPDDLSAEYTNPPEAAPRDWNRPWWDRLLLRMRGK